MRACNQPHCYRKAYCRPCCTNLCAMLSVAESYHRVNALCLHSFFARLGTPPLATRRSLLPRSSSAVCALQRQLPVLRTSCAPPVCRHKQLSLLCLRRSWVATAHHSSLGTMRCAFLPGATSGHQARHLQLSSTAGKLCSAVYAGESVCTRGPESREYCFSFDCPGMTQLLAS